MCSRQLSQNGKNICWANWHRKCTVHSTPTQHIRLGAFSSVLVTRDFFKRLVETTKIDDFRHSRLSVHTAHKHKVSFDNPWQVIDWKVFTCTTVSHVSSYTVVRMMSQVNGGGSFRPLELRNPWNDSAENRHVWLCPPFYPMVAAADGVGRWVNMYLHVLLFGFFNAPTAYAEKRGFHSMHPKMCFGGGCVPLGLFCLEG